MNPTPYTLKVLTKDMKKEGYKSLGQFVNAKLRAKGFDVDQELKTKNPEQALQKFARQQKMGFNEFLRSLAI